MTKEQKIQAYSMRLDGYSLQEIADGIGVSKQAVSVAIPSIEKRAVEG